MARDRSRLIVPSKDFAYKGYYAKHNFLRDEYHISKDGFVIGSAPTPEAVKRAIDEIVNPVRAPSRRGQKLFSAFMLRPASRSRIVSIPDLPNEALDIGRIVALVYASNRGGKEIHYRHDFKVSSRPLLAVSVDGKQLIIVGGRYRFTKRGIVDK